LTTTAASDSRTPTRPSGAIGIRVGRSIVADHVLGGVALEASYARYHPTVIPPSVPTGPLGNGPPALLGNPAATKTAGPRRSAGGWDNRRQLPDGRERRRAGDRWRARSGLSPRGIGRRDLRRLSAAGGATICSVVRSLTDADHSWKVSTLERGWSATTVARLAGLLDPLSSLGSALSMATSVLVCSPTLSVPTASRSSRSRRSSWNAESGELRWTSPTAVQMRAVGVAVLARGTVCDSVRRNTRTEERMLR
jgi:hypothetical protein